MRKYLLSLVLLVSTAIAIAQIPSQVSFPGDALNLTNSGGAAIRTPVISGLGATYTLLARESGSTILLDRAAGIVLTLPAPAAGTYYDLVATVSVTSNAYKISTGTQGTDFFLGPLISDDTDTSDALVGFPCNGTSHDNISMAGTTTGGLLGTHIRIKALTSTIWHVSGVINGSGSVATSCSTS